MQAMNWLRKLLCITPKEEVQGITLDISKPYYEIRGKTDFPKLFGALSILLPQDAILYFEGGYYKGKSLAFFQRYAIEEQCHVAVGILWPRPEYFHVPATHEILLELSKLSGAIAEPELAIHFHAYRQGTVLLQWHDAFSDPMFISSTIPEEIVQAFAASLGMTIKLISSSTT